MKKIQTILPYPFLLWLILVLAVADAPGGEGIDRAVAETLLLYQRDNGGWPKNFRWGDRIDASKKKELLSQKQQNDTTIDNSATYKEIRYLAQASFRFEDLRYRQAALEGIRFLLVAQYDNGGWPQYYPDAQGYHRHQLLRFPMNGATATPGSETTPTNSSKKSIRHGGKKRG